MPGHDSLAVAVQPELLLNSVVAVSALKDYEFQRDIVQKTFFLVCFVSLVGSLTKRTVEKKQTGEKSEAVLCAFIVSIVY